MTDTKTGGGFSNVIHGVISYVESPAFQAVLAPIEAELVNKILGLLKDHAEKTATPIDNVLVSVAGKYVTGKLLQPIPSGNYGNK